SLEAPRALPAAHADRALVVRRVASLPRRLLVSGQRASEGARDPEVGLGRALPEVRQRRRLAARLAPPRFPHNSDSRRRERARLRAGSSSAIADGGSTMRSHSLLLLALLANASPVLAADYLPLQVGNRWTYSSVSTAFEQTEIVGTFERDGATVYVMQYSDRGANPGLLNFWTSESDGGVLLWGFNRTLDNF